jgi:transposase
VGGDKLFVDYAGDTVPVIVDRLTGELRQAQIFVAVMGAFAPAAAGTFFGDTI